MSMSRKERIAIRQARVDARNKAKEEQLRAQKEHEKELENLIMDKPDPDKKINVDICIHCFRYQHRLSWMLSSIWGQKGDVPNITINISHTDNDGTPTTQEVCDFFKEKGLNIVQTKLTEKEVPNRAIARNKQIEQTKSGWILFADSDLVYDPYFFEDLQKQIKDELYKETRVMGANRYSLNDQFCIKYFEEDNREYPCLIENTTEIVSKFPVKWFRGSGIAAGYFQLANVQSIMAHGGKYTYVTRDIWRATKSDRHFRCNMGGRVPITVKPIYHLNHDRGGPDIQR